MTEVNVMKFHILGLPHTITAKWWGTCAFTQKVEKLCRILHDSGHTVIHYGVEGSDVKCTEHVNVMDRTTFVKTESFNNWKSTHSYDVNDEYHQQWYKNCTEEVKSRIKSNEFLLLPWGGGHRPVVDGLGDIVDEIFLVESGIGYDASWQFAPYRVYESHTFMGLSYGKKDGWETENSNIGRPYDAVIPNHWDPEDFEFSPQKEDYILFFGRILKTKGTWMIADMIKANPNLKFKIAGQYKAFSDNVPDILRESPNVELLGYVENDERAQLMSKAKAVICASSYYEPFGGVAVEAQMCGTPVIASDWGAYSETILHGITGFRCRTVNQYLEAADKVSELNPYIIRQWATDNYSLDRASEMYNDYFDMLYNDRGSLTLADRKIPESNTIHYRVQPTNDRKKDVAAIMCYDGMLDYAKNLKEQLNKLYDDLDIMFFSFDGNRTIPRLLQGANHIRNNEKCAVGLSRVESRKYCAENNIPFILLDRQDFIPLYRELPYCDLLTYMDISNRLYKLSYNNVYIMHPDIFIKQDFRPYFEEMMDDKWSTISSLKYLNGFKELPTLEECIEMGSQKVMNTAARLPSPISVYNKDYIKALYKTYGDNKGIWDNYLKDGLLTGDCGWFDFMEFKGFKHKIFNKPIMTEDSYITYEEDLESEHLCFVHDGRHAGLSNFLHSMGESFK